jgi:hypothetical protein
MENEQSTLQLDNAYRSIFERIMTELGIEDNKQAYLLLATYGYSMGVPATDFKRQYTVTRVSYLGVEDKALIAAMAMEPGAAEPPSMAVAYQLAERYANGGAQLITELLDSPKGFARAFREIVEHQRAQWQKGHAHAAETDGLSVEFGGASEGQAEPGR